MEHKPGTKTTEFWTAILGIIATAIPALASALSGYPWVTAILGGGAVVLPAIYIWGRAILKAEMAKETDVIPDNWEPIVNRIVDIAQTLAVALPRPNQSADENRTGNE